MNFFCIQVLPAILLLFAMALVVDSDGGIPTDVHPNPTGETPIVAQTNAEVPIVGTHPRAQRKKLALVKALPAASEISKPDPAQNPTAYPNDPSNHGKILTSHGKEIHRLDGFTRELKDGIRTNGVDVHHAHSRINNLENDFTTHQTEANAVQDNHAEGINSLIGAAEQLNETQGQHGQQIETLGNTQAAHKSENDAKFAEHKQLHDKTHIRFGQFDVKLNEQARLNGETDSKLEELKSDYDETNKTVKEHAVELPRIDGIVKKNLSDISGLDKTQKIHREKIDKHRQAYDQHVEADKEKHNQIGIQFGTVNQDILGLKDTATSHQGRLDGHDTSIQTLKSNLSQERTARTAAHDLLKAEQTSHGAQLSGIGTTLKEHKLKHAELKGDIQNVDEKVGQFQEKYNEKNLENDQKFLTHTEGIRTNAVAIDGLHQTTNLQGQNIDRAHQLITGLNGDIGTINGRIDGQGEIIGQHTTDLDHNKEEFVNIHKKFDAHHGRLDKADSENELRIKDIKKIDAKVDEKADQIHSKIDETIGEVIANKSAIGEHNVRLDQHENDITGLSTVQKSHAASLLEHNDKHTKHEIALNDIDARFEQNSGEVQALRIGNVKIHSAIMEAENALATKVLEGEQEVKVASEHAFEYTQDAIKVIAEKMAIIEGEQKAQMELIKTHIIKEANNNNETKEKFIENKIEEAAAIAEEKAQEDAVIMANDE